MRQYFEFVRSELNELETRDVDQLFDCLLDNLREMNQPANEDVLRAEIERQVAAEKRSSKAGA